MTTCLICNEDMTSGLARMLAATARPGQTFLLEGPVGAGKTHFARAFIRARQGDTPEDVPSPTFTLVQTYEDEAGVAIWHSDLYRLTDPSELIELGLTEAMADAICLIEWPDRLDSVPGDAIRVRLEGTDDPHLRQVRVTGHDTARAVARTRFVTDAGWGDARVEALAGDASARRYFRLIGPGGTAMLMDDPSGACRPFMAMTRWLRAGGFGAPRMLAQDLTQGLLLVEDLGRDRVADVLARTPALAPSIYARITDLLLDLHHHPVPTGLVVLDGALLARQVALFAQNYPGAADLPGTVRIGPVIAALHEKWARDATPVTALRDFHAENLIWRGAAPLGLIDYQDAVACHPAYDLVSALQDARRDVDPAIEADCIARYLNAGGHDPVRFRAAYALLGAQRNLRILGIFVRLCLRDGKPRYLDFIPRVWGYLQRDLRHPALAPLATLLDGLSPPDRAFLDRIARRCHP